MALAVYFAQPLALPSADLGDLWDRWRDRYPTTQDQPPLPPVPPESFDAASPGVMIQFLPALVGSRVWFGTSDGDHVVQVQRDRLVHNWLRTAVDEPYPRYELLRPAFVKDLDDLNRFVEDKGYGRLSVLQAELTYVNPVPVTVLGVSKDLSRLVSPWSGRYSDGFLPEPEDLRITARYRIPDPGSGAPLGRLYVEAAPAVHPVSPDKAPEEVYILQLHARGRPVGDDTLQGALGFLDRAHEWIVRGFTSFTTKTMHDEWGLNDDDHD